MKCRLSRAQQLLINDLCEMDNILHRCASRSVRDVYWQTTLKYKHTYEQIQGEKKFDGQSHNL